MASPSLRTRALGGSETGGEGFIPKRRTLKLSRCLREAWPPHGPARDLPQRATASRPATLTKGRSSIRLEQVSLQTGLVDLRLVG